VNKNVTIDQLYNLREDTALPAGLILKIDLLLQAMTDWPSRIDSVSNFLVEVKYFLKIDNLDHKSISLKMNELDAAQYAWQLESLSSVIDILEIEKYKNFESIIDDLVSETGSQIEERFI